MSLVEMEQQKRISCYADYVVDVPKVIINHKTSKFYDCLQMLGSVSDFYYILFSFAAIF